MVDCACKAVCGFPMCCYRPGAYIAGVKKKGDLCVWCPPKVKPSPQTRFPFAFPRDPSLPVAPRCQGGKGRRTRALRPPNPGAGADVPMPKAVLALPKAKARAKAKAKAKAVPPPGPAWGPGFVLGPGPGHGVIDLDEVDDAAPAAAAPDAAPAAMPAQAAAMAPLRMPPEVANALEAHAANDPTPPLAPGNNPEPPPPLAGLTRWGPEVVHAAASDARDRRPRAGHRAGEALAQRLPARFTGVQPRFALGCALVNLLLAVLHRDAAPEGIQTRWAAPNRISDAARGCWARFRDGASLSDATTGGNALATTVHTVARFLRQQPSRGPYLQRVIDEAAGVLRGGA